jgi:hypothetical protein
MNDKHHEMLLDQIHASGVEEWYCPTCGRRFLVQWPPAYKVIVVAPGNQDIRHNLSRANYRIGPPQITQAEESGLIEESRLIPWLRWMEKADFDGMWGKTP